MLQRVWMNKERINFRTSSTAIDFRFSATKEGNSGRKESNQERLNSLCNFVARALEEHVRREISFNLAIPEQEGRIDQKQRPATE